MMDSIFEALILLLLEVGEEGENSMRVPMTYWWMLLAAMISVNVAHCSVSKIERLWSMMIGSVNILRSRVIFTSFSVYVTLDTAIAARALLAPFVCAARYWSVALFRNSRVHAAEAAAANNNSNMTPRYMVISVKSFTSRFTEIQSLHFHILMPAPFEGFSIFQRARTEVEA